MITEILLKSLYVCQKEILEKKSMEDLFYFVKKLMMNKCITKYLYELDKMLID